MVIRGLIFDFDGLILETEEPVYQSWQELYRSFGQDLDFETWAVVIGKAEGAFDIFAELERRVGHKLERKALAPQRRQRELDLIARQTVLPGVEAYLRAAQERGLKLGVASSSSCAWVDGHLTRLGLRHFFECVKTSDDVQQAKPDPELYRLVLAELGLHPWEAVAFEDSPHGVTSAKTAGIFTVAVPNPLTRRMDLSQADLRLESLAQAPLEDLLRKIVLQQGK